MEQKDKKIIFLVEDEFGALSRIIELFGSRGYNLLSVVEAKLKKDNFGYEIYQDKS